MANAEDGRRLDGVDDDELVDLVEDLWSQRGYRTRVRTAGSETFVLAKHADPPEGAPATELVWVAGRETVSSSGVDRLRATAEDIGASHTCVVTVGAGGVADASALEAETVRHLPESDLVASIEDVGLADRLPDAGDEAFADESDLDVPGEGGAGESPFDDAPTVDPEDDDADVLSGTGSEDADVLSGTGSEDAVGETPPTASNETAGSDATAGEVGESETVADPTGDDTALAEPSADGSRSGDPSIGDSSAEGMSFGGPSEAPAETDVSAEERTASASRSVDGEYWDGATGAPNGEEGAHLWSESTREPGRARASVGWDGQTRSEDRY